MKNFTAEHRAKLEDYLANHSLPRGIGEEDSACTVAAINLAISGKLTDSIPACMSEVLGKAAIRLQDAMPDDMRNSQRYKTLIPNMAGSGRSLEKERLAVLMDWMWSLVLPQLQSIADEGGYGEQWQIMCRKRTKKAAADAADAAYAADAAAGGAYDAATDAAAAAAVAAARAAAHAVYAATDAADAVYAATDAADAATDAADAAADTGVADFWSKVDPIGVLERMTYLQGKDTGIKGENK